MLSLSTAMNHPSRGSLEDRIRTILDCGIPGVVICGDDDLVELPDWKREISAAGHTICAVEAPRSLSSGREDRLLRHTPSLASLDTTERKQAIANTIETMAAAQATDIPRLILVPPRIPDDGSAEKCRVKLAQVNEKIARLGADAQRDPHKAGQIETWLLEHRNWLKNTLRVDDATQKQRQAWRDALLRSLDSILEEADRRGITMALRETGQMTGLPLRRQFEEIGEIFRGAPLQWLADPAAAECLSILRGDEQVDPLPGDPHSIAGFLLRDRSGTVAGALPGQGEMDLHDAFSPFRDDALRIIEVAAETTRDQIVEISALCRQLGIDGSPPPQPGDPFPIIGGN